MRDRLDRSCAAARMASSMAGHGWQLGDEGGGYWLGAGARRGARARDRPRGSSTLLERLLVAWPETLTLIPLDRYANGAGASLAPHVLTPLAKADRCAADREEARRSCPSRAGLLRHFPDTPHKDGHAAAAPRGSPYDPCEPTFATDCRRAGISEGRLRSTAPGSAGLARRLLGND